MGSRTPRGFSRLSPEWAGVGSRPPDGNEVPNSGRVLVLPGIYNVRFHLRGFVRAVQEYLPPGFDIHVKPWGLPFAGLYNLYAEDRNRATARRFADGLARWRRAHPETPLYLVGYSGGGGLATLVVAALPDDIRVDRLILVAPAIAPDFPLVQDVLPKVGEFAVNYASRHDHQVGWGTRLFGTIDRQKTESAGAVGFACGDSRLLEWHWTPSARRVRHYGNHLGYLGRHWQAAALLPALDPSIDRETLRRRLAETVDSVVWTVEAAR